MRVWVKLGFTALAAGAVYSAFRKPPPPPPDTAVSATDVTAMLNTVLAYSNHVCLDVPELPRGRFAKPGALAPVLAPGERRPWLEDLVAAGVVLHNPAEKVADHAEDFPRVETFRVAPAYRKDYEPGGIQKGHLCFATIEVESVQSVRRFAPGSGDRVVQFRYKVSRRCPTGFGVCRPRRAASPRHGSPCRRVWARSCSATTGPARRSCSARTAHASSSTRYRSA